MKLDIIRQTDKLKREVWSFTLHSDFGASLLRFDGYTIQTRQTERCRTWDTKERWGDLDRRNDTMPKPPSIPADVKTELYSRLKEEAGKLPIRMRGV